MSYSWNPKKFEDCTPSEKEKIVQSGLSWYKLHTTHVNNIMSSEESNFAPSGSDMFHPELFKAAHWNWFMGMTKDVSKIGEK